MESIDVKVKALNKLYKKLVMDKINEEVGKISDSDFKILSIIVDDYDPYSSVELSIEIDDETTDEYEVDAIEYNVFVKVDWPSNFSNLYPLNNGSMNRIYYYIQSVLLEVTFYVETGYFKLNTMFLDKKDSELYNGGFISTGERVKYKEAMDVLLKHISEYY